MGAVVMATVDLVIRSGTVFGGSALMAAE